ncbi:hypothetical protein NW759_004960 [Fusarium solani]|nr:hypothetical protein NW759_004960 [Fusarium solani]
MCCLGAYTFGVHMVGCWCCTDIKNPSPGFCFRQVTPKNTSWLSLPLISEPVIKAVPKTEGMSTNTLDTTEKGRVTLSQPRDPKTPLRVGDIVSNLRDPVVDFTVLNAEVWVPIPEENIRTTIQDEFYPKLRNPKEAKVVHFARIRGLEVQNIDGIPKSELKILETQVLSHPKGYLDNSMNLEPVRAWRENNDDCSLCLITGLKTIREPPPPAPIAKSIKLKEEFGEIDSAPDQARTGNQGQYAAEDELEHVDSSDRLLAYRFSTINKKRNKKSMVEEEDNCPQRQVGLVERQQTSGEDRPSFFVSLPMWVIFRRAQAST